MGRIFLRGMLWVAMACAAVWLVDWGVWQVRVLAGSGYRTMTVDRMVVAPLKGGKEEYYPDGQTDVQCSRSLLPEGFPQTGVQPCWWVAKHPMVLER